MVAPADGSRCPSCGADGESGRLYCGHCGARVAEGVEDLEAYRTGPERFDRVQVASGYPAAMRHAPGLAAAREAAWPVVRLAGGAVIAIALAVSAIQTGDGAVIAFVAIAGGVWLVGAARGVILGVRRVRARTERPVAIVAEDRYLPTGFARDPVGTCEHRLSLRDRDGGLRAVWAPAELMGELAIGDIGVAYLRADRLVDFRWFDVMAPPLGPGEIPRARGCDGCGAAQRFGPVSDRCGFCGAALARPDLGEFGARFRAAAGSPAAAEAGRRRIQGGLPSLLPALALVAGGLFFAWVGWQARELVAAAIQYSPWLVLLLAALLGPLVAGAVWLWRGSAPHRAPRENQLALVVRTRSQMLRKRSQNPTWRHFATIAAPSGARRELSVLPATAKGLAPGQIGVAHLRGEWLAGFTRLDGGDGDGSGGS